MKTDNSRLDPNTSQKDPSGKYIFELKRRDITCNSCTNDNGNSYWNNGTTAKGTCITTGVCYVDNGAAIGCN